MSNASKRPRRLILSAVVITSGAVLWVFGPDYFAERSRMEDALWLVGSYLEWLSRVIGFALVMAGLFLCVRAL